MLHVHPSQSLRDVARGILGGGDECVMLSVASLHHLSAAFDIIAGQMEEIEKDRDLLIWRLGLAQDAVRNMAAAARAQCAEPAGNLRDDIAAERQAAEAAVERVQARASSLHRRAAELVDDDEIGRVEAMTEALRSGKVKRLPIAPRMVPRDAAAITEADMLAAINAIADEISPRAPVDALAGGAQPPRDPLGRALSEDGA